MFMCNISYFKEIIISENMMLLEANKKYGPYFNSACETIKLSNDFIKEINPEHYIFALFMSQFNKYLTLSFLSAIRLHYIQSMMNLRIVIEAGTNAAYALSANLEKKFSINELKKRRNPFENKKLILKKYNWLEKKYPQFSKAIKQRKETINSTSAHSNILMSFNNLGVIEKKRLFRLYYFDQAGKKLVEKNLWFIGDINIGLMKLFFRVNMDYNIIKLSSDFIPKLKKFEKDNKNLKQKIVLNTLKKI